MSPSRSSSPSSAKRVPYKAPRDRRELATAIAVGVLLVVVTATLVWFLRPNRESTSTPSSPLITTTTAVTDTTVPTDTTPAATDSTVTEDTTPQDTTAPDGG
ncbi:MAG: hypothetical protein ABW033_01980 [Acidimicrobiia bacterium]